jgi:hypothetical protein
MEGFDFMIPDNKMTNLAIPTNTAYAEHGSSGGPDSGFKTPILIPRPSNLGTTVMQNTLSMPLHMVLH